MAGGVMSVLNGGKFGDGFWSAGLTQLAAPGIDLIDQGSDFSAGRVFAAAVVGGTASEITGGKFANGAVTGAFSRAFNDEMHAKEARQYRDRISQLDPKVVMDRASIAGHATALGYFETLDDAAFLVRSPGQASIYRDLMIDNLNRDYEGGALEQAMDMAKGNVTVAGDPAGTTLSVVGTVFSRVGILADLKTLNGFLGTTTQFRDFMSSSPTYEQKLIQVELNSGRYYADNCGRLKC
ncbi:DUF637 domain-containing protein [Endozoicomonas sp. Mp262]|uniref:DUF637 domain-containing protein n=1 Tax=Endozoicomonas sp. Mp262 TaxID=2919499 RepID=UPI0021D88EC2